MGRPLTAAFAAAVVLCAVFAPGGSGAAQKTVSFTWVGDIAMVASSDGGAGFFSPSIRQSLRSDVVIGNLEGTLTSRGYSKCGPNSTQCFAFRAPRPYASVLRRAGFTLMNIANNHAYDYGSQGQADTLSALRSVGLHWDGRPGQISIVTVRGVRIAVIGFAPYPWAQSLTDLSAAERIVKKARTEADIVIAVMHAGAEGVDHQHVHPGTEWFLGENRGDAEDFSHTVIDAGANLVLGSGPHVLRGMEWYHGRLIAYSLGNFLGDGTLSIGGILGESAILHVTLGANGAWVRARLVPVDLASPGVPVVENGGPSTEIVRTLSQQDFGRNAMRVTAGGSLLPPAWRTG